ncbi:MAG: hypothetical protein KFF77_00145 [Bacteroidetes bacterium]|nr:hypothetical protein [Bacteroidota bacterium]
MQSLTLPGLIFLLTLLVPAPLGAQIPQPAAQENASDDETLGSWKRVLMRTEFTLWDVTCSDSLHCHAVGDYGVIIRSSDGGGSWTQKLSPNQFALRSIHFFDDSTGITAGFRGSCFRTTDRGESWQTVNLETEATLPGMSVVGNTVWLSGEEGTMLRSSDRGATWTRLASGTDVMLDAISFADARHGWASSVQRTMLRTTDGGDTWTAQDIDSFLPVTTICARSAEECWAAGQHGLLLRTLDGGASWQRIEAYETDYVSIAFDSCGTGWAVGRRGAIVRGERDNLRWRLHDLTTAVSLHGITFLPNNTALAVGLHGMLFRQGQLYPPPAETGETKTP